MLSVAFSPVRDAIPRTCRNVASGAQSPQNSARRPDVDWRPAPYQRKHLHNNSALLKFLKFKFNSNEI
jgi:hypothetical protein